LGCFVEIFDIFVPIDFHGVKIFIFWFDHRFCGGKIAAFEVFF